MTRSVTISDDTRDRQRRAADPKFSIWVEANAGSGKTHVLTERVLRLLLSGVPPETILCLTYTKAAAAEMRKRVSQRLSEWAVLEDAELDAKLSAMENRRPDAALRLRARTLFAHALETPGGLKIVTIHAFCEAILHRFPLEAAVPFDFSVIEDEEKEQMVLEAREAVLAGGLNGDPTVAGAVATLFELLSDNQIKLAIEAALADGRKLRPVLADPQGSKVRLRALTEFHGRSRAVVNAEIVSQRLFGPAEIARLHATFPPNLAGGKFEDKLARLDPLNPSPRQVLLAFLKKDGGLQDKFPKKDIWTKTPDLAALIEREAHRLHALAADLKLATLIERSEAMVDVLGAISAKFESRKRARSLLDFDDLIERVRDLFSDESIGPWVQYKLDAGIVHILVDESQDTNPEQWETVKAIAREFFVGDSAVERPRTLFAVGDEKQSIYSFQGADPKLFGEAGREFAASAKRVGKPFDRIPLQTSFRTLPKILEAVDLVFARPDIREAVLAPADSPVHHDTARSDLGGTVTLWPVQQQTDDNTDPDNWPLEAPKNEKGAARLVAERIAREIASWVKSGRPLGPRLRPVRPDDVLILVQTRGILFRELIRALLRENLPTPGADRLEVTTHIAVLDLVALGDVMLNPADDLQLAALLRSPLFDVSEDDLYALAHDRYGRLWDGLARSRIPAAKAAYESLHGWRGKLDFERPYEFFAEILYAENGLRKYHARMGAEVDDVFAEFLAMALEHEQTPQPSLQGFLVSVRGRDVLIKRELAESGSGVRVMTVHGAKGLEAPIVILADAATKPAPGKLGKPVYVLKAAPGPLLVHAPKGEDHVKHSLAIRKADEANQQEEYWRKLYVGMTRAEDELYVTGFLTKIGKVEGSWYHAIEGALRENSEVVADAEGIETALIYPADRQALTGAVAAVPSAASAFDRLVLPPLPGYHDTPYVRPSSAFEPAETAKLYETALDSVSDADAARREGIALHALLQHLGRFPPAERPLVVDRAMPILLPDAPDRHPALAAKAAAILDSPVFTRLFGPNSRAELPFLVEASRSGNPIRIAGRIDRLVVDDTHVLVVDYKSDASPPLSTEEVPGNYLTQLGLYALVAGQLFPGRTIEVGILWTALESLMILPPGRLDPMVSAFTLK